MNIKKEKKRMEEIKENLLCHLVKGNHLMTRHERRRLLCAGRQA
jgi:hypothetical protein